MHPEFHKYFKYSEFDSPDRPDSGEYMNEDFLYKLTEARIIAKIPFKINSGYRTKEHNARVGGVLDSSHTKGYAADIAVRSNTARYIILNALMQAGFNRFGIGNTYIHVDCDPDLPSNVMWHYYGK